MKERKELFGPNEDGFHIHVGLRMVKTSVAVFICAIIGYFRGQPSIFTIIAAILCMQNSSDKTFTTSLNRSIGTVIGGLFGLGVLYLCRLLGVVNILPLYYLVISLMIIPIILSTLLIRRPAISAFSCVVFFGVTVSHFSDEAPSLYALNRVVDTLVGIVVTLLIDRILPYSLPRSKGEETKKMPAAADGGQTEKPNDGGERGE